MTRENDPAAGRQVPGAPGGRPGTYRGAGDDERSRPTLPTSCTLTRDVGTLEAGKLADFIVLDRDPFTHQPLSIADVMCSAPWWAAARCTRRPRSPPSTGRAGAMVHASCRLEGTHVRLEPLDCGPRRVHCWRPARASGELFRWTTVPQDRWHGMREYVAAAVRAARGQRCALRHRAAGDGVVVGSTRFFDIERWAWPPASPRARGQGADNCEIGYTWLSPRAIRTATNTEAKYLMFRHAFEQLARARGVLPHRRAQRALVPVRSGASARSSRASCARTGSRRTSGPATRRAMHPPGRMGAVSARLLARLAAHRRVAPLGAFPRAQGCMCSC